MLLLPLDEGKAGAEFQEEGFDLAENGRLKVFFAVGVLEPEEIEDIRIAEDEIGRQRVAVAEGLQFLFDQFFRLLRDGRTLVEHRLDALLQRPRAPALDAAHFGVKVALKRVLEINDRLEMGPAQLSQQCGDNLEIGKRLRETDHVAQRLVRVAPAELLFQLSPQCGDNFFPIRGPLFLEDVAADAIADMPVSQYECRIDRLVGSLPSSNDDLPNFRE